MAVGKEFLRKKIKNNLCRLPGSRAVGKVFFKKNKKNNFLKKIIF
jgi:hypothetical protein